MTFADFPEIQSRIFTTKHEVPKNFSSESLLSELTNQVFFQCEIFFFLRWLLISFPLSIKFQLQKIPKKKHGFILQRWFLDGVSPKILPKQSPKKSPVCIFNPPKIIKSAARLFFFTVLFLQFHRLMELATWLISCESPCDLGISRNSAPSLWLNWGGRGVCVCVNCLDDQENILKVTRVVSNYTDQRNFSRGAGTLKPWWFLKPDSDPFLFPRLHFQVHVFVWNKNRGAV